ncbi:MAG TPA: response regulator transcription factor [Saprospiraceae bacterium]|nr:response regulator transcription factor [Saprospiraceae bacterium]
MEREINKVSIVIVEDEALIAEDIKEICEEAGYEVVSVCYRAGQALHILESQDYDMVLLDINLEDELSGIDLANFIMQKKIKTPYIFLTSYSDAITLNAVKAVHPMGYVVKPFTKEQLLSTIEISLFNYSRYSLVKGFNKFELESRYGIEITSREMEILGLIAEGKNNNQIADKTQLSINTIKFHIKNIYDKLHVSSRSQLFVALGKV